MSESTYLLTCSGRDRPGFVADLSEVISSHGANIRDSRMALLGGRFAVLMEIGCPVNLAESLEGDLRAHAESEGMQLTLTDAREDAPAPGGRIYRLRADTMDHPGIVHEVTSFLSERGLNVLAMETTSWAAPHTGTPMFSLDMTLTVPLDLGVRELGEEFDAWCDATDLDATLEPLRGQ